MRRKLLTVLVISLAFFLLNIAVTAQLPPLPPPPGDAVATFSSSGIPLQAKVATMGFRAVGMDASPVKGNPFCGTITSEHTQAFTDGNHIHTTESSMLCRDSQGRIRREAQVNVLGGVPPQDPPKIVTIVDPVAGFRYMLDSNLKIARRMPIEPPALSADGAPKGPGQTAVIVRGESVSIPDAPANATYFYTTTIGKNGGPQQNQPATENLGDQTIGGIHATGSRVITTIPAGQMGNEQPITVVSENWYSPELKATVMTKHTDPWAGELKTQLTNVNSTEPDSSLFTIPSDYKVVDDKPIQIKLPPPPAQE